MSSSINQHCVNGHDPLPERIERLGVLNVPA